MYITSPQNTFGKLGIFYYISIYIKLIMARYYEDLHTLIELVKKLDSKKITAEFILKLARVIKENPEKSISDAIKEAKDYVL